MDRNILAMRTKTAERRRPTALRYHSGIRPEPLACRNILLVEHRDEVFSRLATDLTAAGLQVSRAGHAAGAMKEFVRCSVDLLVANFDLPDSSGWLLTAKLRLVSLSPRIWLYAPWPSLHEMAMSKFVGADGLIAYRGDVCRLSAVIISRVTVLPAPRLSA
ncbi:MAG: response regulator [Pirellulaceae bacterium]